MTRWLARVGKAGGILCGPSRSHPASCRWKCRASPGTCSVLRKPTHSKMLELNNDKNRHYARCHAHETTCVTSRWRLLLPPGAQKS